MMIEVLTIDKNKKTSTNLQMTSVLSTEIGSNVKSATLWNDTKNLLHNFYYYVP